MKGSVDRIEFNKIIIIFDNKVIREIDKSLYPDLKEGDRIIDKEGIIIKDEASTISKRKKMASLQKRLFRRRLNEEK